MDDSRWPRAVVFDLDGTLIDSVPDITAALNAMLASQGRSVSLAEVRRQVGDGARHLVTRILAANDLAHDDAAVDAATAMFLADYHAHPSRATQPYPGLQATLEALRRDRVKLGICSNKPADIAERVLADLDLRKLFDVVVGAGRYAMKPDPEPLLACLAQMDCAVADALYVGDMVMDREAARAAGLPVVLATFGYSPLPVTGLKPDATLDAWNGFPVVLQRLRAARRVVA